MPIPDIVICFDRDYTVDVNPHPDREAVPLAWVQYLAHEADDIHVWATGNQSLVGEARIPGTSRAKKLWEAYRNAEEGLLTSSGGDEDYRPSRKERLRLVKDLYEVPNPESEMDFIVVDDIDLRRLEREGWKHYFPWDFVEAVKAGTAEVAVPDDIDFDGEPYEYAFTADAIDGTTAKHYTPVEDEG